MVATDELSAKPLPHAEPIASAQSTSNPAWQPPSIPLTLGAAFQSWIRPSHHDGSRHGSRSGSPSASGSATPTKATTIDDTTTASGAPFHPVLSAPVNLQYSGRFDQLAAQSELYLYSAATPYFQGAHIGNVSNPIYRGGTDVFNDMWKQGQIASKQGDANPSASYPAEQRATIATQPHTDGKVASIRWVSVDPEPEPAATQSHSGAWFSWVTRKHHQRAPPHCLNVLEIGTPAESEGEEKVVLLHGYGAGTGFFFQNVAALASRPNSRLYALDWLGMGRSSRPHFSIPNDAVKDPVERVHAAEKFFIDSLEAWRAKAGIEKMNLVAHSLGGYLSVAYALRYPQRVSRLVLVSPAGIGANPETTTTTPQDQSSSTFQAKNASFVPEHSRGNIDADAASMHSVEREVMEPQSETTPANASQVAQDVKAINGGDARAQAPTSSSPSSDKNSHNPPRISPRTRAFFGWLWEQNVSPFGILRGSQFLGPWLMSRYTTRRFGSLPDEELKALHSYCQGVFLAKGSGEYCLAHLLAPGAWARLPVIDRVGPLSQQLPVSFIYGEHDWMDAKAGYEVVKKLQSQGNQLGRCFIVPHSGHHVYLDNPRAFDRLVTRILDGEAENSKRGQDDTAV